MKKVYTAAFKAQVALDLLKEEKTLAQISAEYGVHANVLRDWCGLPPHDRLARHSLA